ncbi:MAG: hypothetical protein AB8I08_34295 [Sandaracinaceae bacterium]
MRAAEVNPGLRTAPPSYRGAPGLGEVVRSYGRTLGQNLAAAAFVVALFLPALGVYLVSPERVGLLLLGLLVGVVPSALIVRQILPNWNVRWTLFERGFEHRRGGRTHRYRYDQVAAIHRLAGREARLEFHDGTTLTLEALSEGEAIASQIDSAIASERAAVYRSRLEAGESIVLGPLRFTGEELHIGELRFKRGALVVHDASTDQVVHGNTELRWLITSADGAVSVEVPLGDVPLAAVELM